MYHLQRADTKRYLYRLDLILKILFVEYDLQLLMQRHHLHYRDYYLNERWREELSSEAIDLINTTLDRELMDYFGYELL